MTAAATRAAPIGDRLPLLVGLGLAALSLRPQVVGVGPVIRDIQVSFGISHAVAGLLITVPVLCLGIFAPVAPVIAGRIGAVNAVTIASALIAGAGIARAVAPGIGGLLAFTLLVGVGMGLGNALMVIAVKERFADHPLLVTSVYSVGIQAGATLAAAAAVPIAMWLGSWRWSLFALSLAALAGTVAWVALTRGARGPRPHGVLPRFPLRSGVAWVLVAMFGLMGMIFYGLTAWAPAAYTDMGFSGAFVAWLPVLCNVGTLPTTLAVGFFGGRLSRRRALVCASSAMVAATLALAFAPSFGLAAMLVVGLANGAMFTLTMSLPLDVADSPIDVGAVAGMMLLFGYLVTAAAPSALGWVRDVTGSFDLVLLAFPVAAACFLLLTLTLSEERLRRGVRPAA